MRARLVSSRLVASRDAASAQLSRHRDRGVASHRARDATIRTSISPVVMCFKSLSNRNTAAELVVDVDAMRASRFGVTTTRAVTLTESATARSRRDARARDGEWERIALREAKV